METLRRQMEKIIKNQDICNKVLKHLIESIEQVENWIRKMKHWREKI